MNAGMRQLACQNRRSHVAPLSGCHEINYQKVWHSISRAQNTRGAKGKRFLIISMIS
jgi:hypothetical protein